jgi:hypothetical protein
LFFLKIFSFFIYFNIFFYANADQLTDLKFLAILFQNGICSVDNSESKITAHNILKTLNIESKKKNDLSLFNIYENNLSGISQNKLKNFNAFKDIIKKKKNLLSDKDNLLPPAYKMIQISVTRINCPPEAVKTKKDIPEIIKAANTWHLLNIKYQSKAVVSAGYKINAPNNTTNRWHIIPDLSGRGFNKALFLWEMYQRNNAFESENFNLSNTNRICLKISQEKPFFHISDTETLSLTPITYINEILPFKAQKHRDPHTAILNPAYLLRRKFHPDGNDISVLIKSTEKKSKLLQDLSSLILEKAHKNYIEQEKFISQYFKKLTIFENPPEYIKGTGLFMVHKNRDSLNFKFTPLDALKAQIIFEIHENWPIKNWNSPGLPEASEIFEINALGKNWKKEPIIRKRYHAVILDALLKQLIPWIHASAIRPLNKNIPEPIYKKAGIKDFIYKDIVNSKIKKQTELEKLNSLYNNFNVTRKGSSLLPTYEDFRKAYLNTFENLIKMY